MTTQQILIRLPEDVAARLKAVVPSRKRNQFVLGLVEAAIAEHEANLRSVARSVTADELGDPELQQEMRDWDSTAGDGIESDHDETD